MDFRVVRAGLMWLGRGTNGSVVNTVMNLRVPYNVEKFLSSCTTGGFSRRSQLHEVSLVSVFKQYLFIILLVAKM
jgi:hypothetical protein